jgi:hypothetical protein
MNRRTVASALCAVMSEHSSDCFTAFRFFENLALDDNTRVSHRSKRSTIFRLFVVPTIQSSFETRSTWNNNLGTDITDSWPIPAEEEEEEEVEEDVSNGDYVGNQERVHGVALPASILFEPAHGSRVDDRVNDQDMPETRMSPTSNVGSGNNDGSNNNNSEVGSPIAPNDPNYPAPELVSHGRVNDRDNDQDMPEARMSPTSNVGSGNNDGSDNNNLEVGSPTAPNDPNYPAPEPVADPVSGVMELAGEPSLGVAPSVADIGPSAPVLEPPPLVILPPVQQDERNEQEQEQDEYARQRNEWNEQELDESSSDESSNHNRDTLPNPVVRGPIQPAPVVPSPIVREPVLFLMDESSSDKSSIDNHWNIPAPIVPAPIVRAPIVRAPIVPAPDFVDDDMPTLPRWPISLHVQDLLPLEFTELFPWN